LRNLSSGGAAVHRKRMFDFEKGKRSEQGVQRDERRPIDAVDVVNLHGMGVLTAPAGAGFLLEAGDGLVAEGRGAGT
jgi:hypothetical protein